MIQAFTFVILRQPGNFSFKVTASHLLIILHGSFDSLKYKPQYYHVVDIGLKKIECILWVKKAEDVPAS